MTEAAEYLLKSNSMSGEYIHFQMRCLEYQYLKEDTRLKDLKELLKKIPLTDFVNCPEFNAVLVDYKIPIEDFSKIWNEYFEEYLNKNNIYSIARLIYVKLCDNMSGFPMKIILKDKYNSMDENIKLVDL